MKSKARTLTALFLVGALLALAVAPTTAADDTDKAKATQAGDTIGAAYKLADYGRVYKSPEALLMAARLLNSVPLITPDKDFNPKIEVISKEKDAPTVKARGPHGQAAELIKQAEEMMKKEGFAGKELENLQKLASLVKDMGSSRGACGGLKIVQRGLAVGAVETFTIPHNAGLGKIAWSANGSLGVKLTRVTNPLILVNSIAWSDTTVYNVGTKASNITFTITNHHGSPMNYTLYIY